VIGEGIQEEVLRALVEQHAVRERLVARTGAVDPFGWQRCALGAAALAAGEGANLGESDRRGTFCRALRGGCREPSPYRSLPFGLLSYPPAAAPLGAPRSPAGDLALLTP